MGSGYCITGRDDWRGELPRYLVSFLSHATSVVISGRNKISKKSSCRPCLPDIINSGDNQTYECLDVLKTPPDLLVVFGSGAVVAELNECHNTSNWEVCARSNFPSLQLVKKSKLLSATTSIHFPVRQIPQLFQNPFRFGHVVKDNSYFKPVAYSTARHLSSCAGAVKAHNIVYVARYTPQKGQVEFVKHIDPKILENFTIHFYGGESTSKYAEELKAEVARTGLKAVVHGRVPHRQLLDAVRPDTPSQT
eukprot:CAMPEP_0177618512 /NCGR_PEP_ID=MMETSP0419_2-20121207/25626_1 /TAXON_ID=582737 /ORGANISM="Tetraselmis sp., Strain GSL018" /LENGTH=249 /DNA_ID=CAMNT_0019117437 /DNA_START=344 /DNA_END=1093 /DNA_ORIENTATION=+